MDDAVSDHEESQRLLLRQFADQIDRLDTQEENLIDLAADGEIAKDRIKARLHKIQRQRERATERLDQVDVDLSAGQKVIDEHLALLRDAHRLYLNATEANRRRLNQLIYRAIYLELDEDGDFEATTSHANDPYDALYAGQEAHDAVGRQVEADELESAFWRSLAANHAGDEEGAIQMDRRSSVTTCWASTLGRLSAVQGLNEPSVVEVAGIEPLGRCLEVLARVADLRGRWGRLRSFRFGLPGCVDGVNTPRTWVMTRRPG